jgi:hypothetical protein
MGMGVCHRGSVAQAGDSLTGTRDVAHLARELLRQDVDPIDHRDQRRETARQVDAERKAEKARERWTLARCARDYHERVIEPTRTTKHAAQWISSLENHMPASLWNRPVAAVISPELLEVLGQIKPHDRARSLSQGNHIAETMQRIRQRLEAVFEDAIFPRPRDHESGRRREAQDVRDPPEEEARQLRRPTLQGSSSHAGAIAGGSWHCSSMSGVRRVDGSAHR